jgi:type IV pilus biogenesis protein CpaD/CtpE
VGAVVLSAVAVGLLSGCAAREVSATAVEQSVRDGMATQGVELRSVSCPQGVAAEVDATVVCDVDFRDENALGQPVDRVRVVVIATSGEEVRYRLEPLAVGVPDDAEATS